MQFTEGMVYYRCEHYLQSFTHEMQALIRDTDVWYLLFVCLIYIYIYIYMCVCVFYAHKMA